MAGVRAEPCIRNEAQGTRSQVGTSVAVRDCLTSLLSLSRCGHRPQSGPMISAPSVVPSFDAGWPVAFL